MHRAKITFTEIIWSSQITLSSFPQRKTFSHFPIFHNLNFYNKKRESNFYKKSRIFLFEHSCSYLLFWFLSRILGGCYLEVPIFPHYSFFVRKLLLEKKVENFQSGSFFLFFLLSVLYQLASLVNTEETNSIEVCLRI